MFIFHGAHKLVKFQYVFVQPLCVWLDRSCGTVIIVTSLTQLLLLTFCAWDSSRCRAMLVVANSPRCLRKKIKLEYEFSACICLLGPSARISHSLNKNVDSLCDDLGQGLAKAL